MRKSFEQKYHHFEATHFWFKSRRDYILSLLGKTDKSVDILDIGCSSGLLIQDLVNKGFAKEKIYGIDISETAISNCKATGIDNCVVMDAAHITLNKTFDVIIASDCLEHIENDQNAINEWKRLLDIDGKLYVFVPAFKMLWSAHDEANMHYRRYTRKQLVALFDHNDFKVITSGYWNVFLFLPILIYRTFKSIFPSKKKVATHDLESIPIFNTLLTKLLNIENKLQPYIRFPFGVSTYVVVKKTNIKS